MSLPTNVTFSDTDPGGVDADALVLAARKNDGQVVLVEGTGLSAESRSAVEAALAAVGAEAGAEEVTKLAGVDGVAADLVLVVGLPGTGPAPRTELLRRAAGVAARALTGRDKAVFALGQADREEAVAVAEGVALGAYTFADHHGVGKAESAKPGLAQAVVTGLAQDEQADAQVGAITQAVALARDLVNTPPNVLYPESFADLVVEQAAGTAVEVEVWDPQRLEEERCGGILGVGQGSGRGPRMVTLRYTPEGASTHLALVGKGITFDSGGLCIKPGAAMVTMKMDMGGAAACAAATLAIAELGLPVQVTAYLCLAENMTGDLAQRPGDVVTMRDGRTVEIINTDAEGRLVMADALVAAGEESPDAVIDIATLTGAQMVALGSQVGAVMGTDELRDEVVDAAGSAGEQFWPMPLPSELAESMKSQVADISNMGDRFGGMLVAGLFLKEFVGTLPWAHLDIAGPAFNEGKPRGYTAQGGTGTGLRTLLTVLERAATR